MLPLPPMPPPPPPPWPLSTPRSQRSTFCLFLYATFSVSPSLYCRLHDYFLCSFFLTLFYIFFQKHRRVRNAFPVLLFPLYLYILKLPMRFQGTRTTILTNRKLYARSLPSHSSYFSSAPPVSSFRSSCFSLLPSSENDFRVHFSKGTFRAAIVYDERVQRARGS